MNWLSKYAPGILLSVAIALVAWGLQVGEEWLIGRAIIEALVIAILLGMVWRNVIGLRKDMAAGVGFTAKQILETAIVLLGAGVDLPSLLAAGPALIVAVVLAVLIGITASVLIGRAIGLSARLGILVAV